MLQVVLVHCASYLPSLLHFSPLEPIVCQLANIASFFLGRCIVMFFLFFACWQNYKIGRRFIARQPHKVTSRWSTIARQTSKASPQGAAIICYVSLFLASWQKDHNLQQVINITSFSSAASGFVCLNVLLLGLRRSWEIWKQCFVLVVLHTAPDM